MSFPCGTKPVSEQDVLPARVANHSAHSVHLAAHGASHIIFIFQQCFCVLPATQLVLNYILLPKLNSLFCGLKRPTFATTSQIELPCM